VFRKTIETTEDNSIGGGGRFISHEAYISHTFLFLLQIVLKNKNTPHPPLDF
jgi:hypothetical protein